MERGKSQDYMKQVRKIERSLHSGQGPHRCSISVRTETWSRDGRIMVQ
jgi:hypothetical protein